MTLKVIILDYPNGSIIITRVLINRRGSQKGPREGWQCKKGSAGIAGFDNGGRGHEPRNQSSLSRLERAGKWIPP